MKTKLENMINDFLKTRKPSKAGGWAEVTGDEINDLAKIIDTIIMAKYEGDSDGDVPVNFDLTDRTRFQPNRFLKLEHIRSYENLDDEKMMRQLDIAVYNVKHATDQLNTLQTTWKYLLENRRRTKG